MMAYKGWLCPKGVPFTGFKNMKGQLGKQMHAYMMHFMAVKKSRKCSGFVIYSYSKDIAFTAVKRDAKF